MNRNTYDAVHAEALIPLLRSITNEIQEREQAIDRGTAHLYAADASANAAERSRIEAELSVHKRELRLALRELERLGCVLDLDHPLRVLIPSGRSGAGDTFAWSPEDETIRVG